MTDKYYNDDKFKQIDFLSNKPLYCKSKGCTYTRECP